MATMKVVQVPKAGADFELRRKSSRRDCSGYPSACSCGESDILTGTCKLLASESLDEIGKDLLAEQMYP